MDNISAGNIQAATIYPHEEAYRQAPYVFLARVVSFDTTNGVLIKIVSAVRGEIAPESRVYLKGTSRFPFLNAPGTNITVFVAHLEADQAVLWQGATTGGILWSNHGTLELIAAAYADPQTSLTAAHPRARLAAAYYLATGQQTNTADKARVIESLIWGLAQEAPEVNQAALNALRALNIDVQAIAGPYHPGFRPELKRKAARKLEIWRAKSP